MRAGVPEVYFPEVFLLPPQFLAIPASLCHRGGRESVHAFASYPEIYCCCLLLIAMLGGSRAMVSFPYLASLLGKLYVHEPQE